MRIKEAFNLYKEYMLGYTREILTNNFYAGKEGDYFVVRSDTKPRIKQEQALSIYDCLGWSLEEIKKVEENRGVYVEDFIKVSFNEYTFIAEGYDLLLEFNPDTKKLKIEYSPDPYKGGWGKREELAFALWSDST